MVPLEKTSAYKGGAKPKAKPTKPKAKPAKPVSAKTNAKPAMPPKKPPKPNAKREPPKPAMPKKPPARRGGSVISDVSKLAVPFGLIAAKSSLESFLKNRKAKKPPVPPVKPKA